MQQLKSDRFIPDAPQSIARPRIRKHCHKNPDTAIDSQNDPQVSKLYKMLVMDEEAAGHGPDENFMGYNSMKCIADDGIQNGYEYLAKFGIDMSKISLGPTVINKPDRILQALSLSDNFYLNLLDCSSESVLAVGLSRGVYLWKPSGSISRIRQANGISCIKWNPLRPELIACGSKAGSVQVWDAQKNSCLVQFNFHQGRIGTLAWQQNLNCLLSGSKDSNIFSYDLRLMKRVAKYRFHNQQICALKVQPTHHNFGVSDTFASGSNDRNLIIWNTRMKKPQQIYKHAAAIKGVAWHPTKNGILASGGGTQDRSIKIWNVSSNQLVKSIDTGSQVCNLMYIKDGQNLVSSHGFNKFQTNIWQSSSLTKKLTLIGHSKRVLYLAAQPNGQTIITGAGDQTIRFWKFKQDKKRQYENQMQDTEMTIR